MKSGSLCACCLLLGHVFVVSGVTLATYTSIMTVVLYPATAPALKENSGLNELRLYYCHIDAEGISHLEQALHVNTTLRVLDLTGNTVRSQGAKHLGKLIGGVWGYVALDCVNVQRPTK